ncbi:MAG: PaaI family thioesterase [Acidobacteria bacterium]|nr:MAG: PaaI family thioesterase [Acidobacteriota bacterium]
MKVEGRIEFYVIEQTPERVISEMPIQPGIINPFGVVHAGAILWFADVTATFLAMGSSAASEGMAGFPLAITLNANFTSNQKEGTLKAVASFVKKGRTISIVRTTVLGANDRLIADVTTNHLPAR